MTGTTLIRLDLRENRVPIVEGIIDESAALEQFAWLINGFTDLSLLKSKQYDSTDADHMPGFEWRHFEVDYLNEKVDYTGKGVDQLARLVDSIRENPTDRRLVLVSWNPMHHTNTDKPPTHRIAQFYVNDGELSCKFYHKPKSIETDVVSNIFTYALLSHLLAHTCDLTATELIQTIGDADDDDVRRIEKLKCAYENPTAPTLIVKFESKFVATKTYHVESIKLIKQPSSGDQSKTAITRVNDSTQQASHTEEYKYFHLIETILKKGKPKSDRTGTGTIAYFGPEMQFNLENNTVPLLTTKRVFWRGVVEELLWFIKGSTDSLILNKKGIHIWDGNGSKEFLQKVGLGHREEGDLGPVYGFQWRHIGAQYENKKTCYRGKGLDQLRNIIDSIKRKDQNSHLVLSAWNPVDIPLMALPPCHCFAEFSVRGDRVSCLMFQRSADVGLGVPFNIASYALLTHIVAEITGLKAHKLVYTLGDAHIYKDHIELLKEQLRRTPSDFPKVKFRRHIEDIDVIEYEDIELVGYSPQASINMRMSV